MTNILVAEDEPRTAQLIEFKLKQQGYEVNVVSNGEQVIKMLDVNQPSLILLDGMMPVMDGFEVLRRVKSSKEHRHIPVIMLTAKSREKDVVTGLDLGAADYIVKPFSPAELAARIKKVLSSSEDGK
ncbi:MAG: response regulator [Verrucomicrobiales bacterium]|nr:response regulator [Verrucomicrobiales bacterium]|tara:strand:+ start:378 stop:758 length:381 start_codon:yes stop_codon:yes gene_type:complete